MKVKKGRSPSPGKKTSQAPKRTKKEIVQEESLEAKESSSTNVKSPMKVKKGRSPSPGKKTSQAPKRKKKEIVQEESLEAEESSSEKQSDQEDVKNNSDDYESDNSENPKKKFFSDDNAKWLKPKKSKDLISSDEEDEDEVGGDDEMLGDEDDGSSVEMEVEKKSRLLDARMQEEEDEAEEDMREAVSKNTAIYHLPTKEELEKDLDRVVPPSEVRSHIEQILEVLAHFKERREPGRTRSEYVDQLGAFIAELYGYLPELIEYFLTMFSPAECLEFVDYSDKARPLVIRTNTLKTRRKDLALALMKRGVTLDPLASWSKVGLKIIESSVPIGATPEYLSGHYMLQSAASMCPVLALSPQTNERVLDMSAAPGGKTSYMAQLMRNTGVIFANDLKPDRQKATVANMHRLGVKNVIACTHDGRKMPKLFQHYKFDRILLDAPCSGLGVISRDPSCKVQRTLTDVNKTAHLQKELILAAIDMLNHKSKTGGIMVYSTCSVSVAENEEVVNYALQKRHIKIIATGLDFGTYCKTWCLFEFRG
jgi:ribosomal RNA methyltransferase Nop2